MDTDQNFIYSKMLAVVGERSAAIGDRELCLFRTTVGSRWAHNLLVCGRAVNGWEPQWLPARASDEESRSQLLAEILLKGDRAKCPLKWVADLWNAPTGYNTARSAFWRVIRAIAGSLDRERTAQLDWSSRLAWTNLYHIAPGVTGNPSAKLKSLQRSLCQEQLSHDLTTLEPRRVLFLTGLDWAEPFLGKMDFSTRTPGNLVEAAGQLAVSEFMRASVVVAKHPQGKPQARFVESVVQAFAKVAEDFNQVKG